MPQKYKKLANVTTPVSCGSDLRYLLQNSGDSNAKNRTFPKKYPAVCPTELQVLAHPTLRLKYTTLHS